MHKINQPKFNLFTRFIAIWTPNYLQQTLHENRAGSVWGFWFFWNTIIALIATLTLGIMLNNVFTENEPLIWEEIPAFNFVFEDQVLVETGLEEPFRYDVGEDTSGDEFTILLDREGKNYDQDSIKVLDNVMLINSTEFIIKKANSIEYEVYPFSEAESLQALTFNKETAQNYLQKILPTIKKVGAVILFIVLWGIICIFRLLTNLWWALIVWIIGKIMNVSELNYGGSYLFVMSVGIIPLCIEIALLSVGLAFPFSTLLFIILLGAMNAHEVKKS